MSDVAYRPSTSPANHQNGGAINGRGLRHRRLDRNEAAQLAADMVSGRPFTPSIKQAVALTGASARLVTEVLKTRAARQKKAVESEVIITELSSLLTALERAWYAASPEEREGFVRSVGVDVVWDVIVRLFASSSSWALSAQMRRRTFLGHRPHVGSIRRAL